MFSLKITIEVIGHILQLKKTYQCCHKTYHLGQNLLELTPSHSHPHIISLVEPGRCNCRLHWSPPKSLTLSSVHIMTISVINSMSRCRLYNLSKPLLMRMSELKQVCIKEQVPSHEVKVTQRMNEHVFGVICHSASPTGIG